MSMTPTLWSCPECRAEQNQAPEHLARNYSFERAIVKFKDSRNKICMTHDLKKKLRKQLRLTYQSIDNLDCFKHGRSLCHECVHVGLCDGEAASECDIIGLAEYESMLNDRLNNTDEQFEAIAKAIDTSLNIKKNALIAMYRKDPRNLHKPVFLNMQKIIDYIDDVNLEELPRIETTETIVKTPEAESTKKQIVNCDRFLHDNIINMNVYTSICNRYLYYDGYDWGYGFLKHPKKVNDKVLKWTLQIPKFNNYIGIVSYQNKPMTMVHHMMNFLLISVNI